jgi:hypothetical protein
MKMCNFQADSSVFSGRLLSDCAREFAHDVNLVLEQSDSIELLLRDLATGTFVVAANIKFVCKI